MIIKPKRPSVVQTAVENLGYSLAFDENGFLTDTFITGKDSVCQWIERALQNRKYTVPIYNLENSTFGIDKIGVYEKAYPVYIAELEADVRTTLSAHPSIVNVSSFQFERDGRKLIAEFSVFLKSVKDAERLKFALEVSSGSLQLL